MLLWRFDDFIDFMKIKFISKNQYNNNATFGIQIHFKMSKKCIVKNVQKWSTLKIMIKIQKTDQSLSLTFQQDLHLLRPFRSVDP